MKKYLIGTLFVFSLIQGSAGMAGNKPPSFFSEHDRLQPLKEYPLGKYTQQQVFTYHGEPYRKLRLPNGLEGWEYEVGQLKKTVIYEQPNKELKQATETERTRDTHTYVLVFDTRNIVIDVLYNSKQSDDGLTALQLQRKAGGDQDISPPRHHWR